ncbi:formate dehydrogenase subunit alpha [Inhella proteolytica]|uniref:Formate dehydrogenase subunit alpha n=1 Tax=Inhella proteolytica TaxID=2795029 RepID=A0A931J041_9BURK|nr:formate dehydrogenase subunit alpha [Inhella proteolytica]MBH9575650.1 formate dehydrogenase subunit alpha [Inhella proteolytica]
MQTVTIRIDGQAVEARAGESVLEVLQRLGHAPPALCHDPRLPPAPRCRLCSVEVEGQDDPVNSCALPVSEGLVVRSDSPALQAYRHQWLEALGAHCRPEDLERHPQKALHQALRAQGIAPSGQGSRVDDSHPLIHVDLARCISCQRCARVCHELQGQDVWHQLGRGEGVQLVPDSGGSLGASHCVACGACVDACPTAALVDAGGLQPERAEHWTRSVCSYCGVGCELELGTADEQVVGVRPVLDAPVNKGHLCVKGRYGQGFAQSSRRVLTPMLRREDGWQACCWDEALDEVARRLLALQAAHGADSLGVLGSARATNEDNYLTAKFARHVLGTHNVDCCARVCHAPSAAALKTLLGTGAATSSYDDIERTRLFLVAGANPNENHPVVGARIRQQLRRGAAQAIVIDPRRTELAELATVHLALRPGTNLPLLLAMAQVVLAEGLHDRDFIARRVDELEAFAVSVREWTPERAAAICGVEAEAIRQAARLYANTRPALCFHGLGMTEQGQGTEGVMALINLALLCGQIGQPGAGLNPLRGQNNVQGSAHMGCEPGSLAGGIAIEAGRARTEQVWGRALPQRPGLNLMQMLDAAEAGRVRGLLVLGYDLALSLPDSQRSWQALKRLDLLVVQDLYLNETAARFADVFLPACSTLEKDGTFMNAERRVQRVRAALRPRGQSLPDWQILGALAARMGRGEGMQFESAEAIWDEVRQVWPDGAGLSYARLDRGGLQWPCRDEDDPGTRVLHAERFGHGVRTSLRPLDYRPSPEVCDADYPWLLSTGRNLYQFNAATMSGASALQALRPTDTLDLCAADAERLGLREGQRVRVRSRRGSAELPLRIDARLQPGQLFATFHDPAVLLNRLTSSERDRWVHAPEYKVCAVQLERVPD